MRRVETVSVKGTEFGRDENKILRLTEMSASKKESFSFKVLSLIDFKNPEVKKIAEECSSTLALAQSLGDKFDLIKYKELCNEYLYCYEIFDNLAGVYVKFTPENIDDYIEEIETRKYLRDKSEQFNNYFFIQGEDLKQQESAKEKTK